MADLYGDLGQNLVQALQAGQQSGIQNRLFQRQEEEYGRGINQRAKMAKVMQKFMSSGSKDLNDLLGSALSEGLDVESTLKLTTAFKNMNTLDVDQQKLQLGLMNYGLALQKEKREGGLAERKQKLEEVKEFGPGGMPSGSGQPTAGAGPIDWTTTKFQGKPPEQFQPFIEASAQKYQVPPALLASIIQTESSFNPNVPVGKAGEIGMAQMLPTTAIDLGIPQESLGDPKAAVDAAAMYLRKNYDQFGDWHKAALAYNAGPGAIQAGKTPTEYDQRLRQAIGQGGGPQAGAGGLAQQLLTPEGKINVDWISGQPTSKRAQLLNMAKALVEKSGDTTAAKNYDGLRNSINPATNAPFTHAEALRLAYGLDEMKLDPTGRLFLVNKLTNQASEITPAPPPAAPPSAQVQPAPGGRSLFEAGKKGTGIGSSIGNILNQGFGLVGEQPFPTITVSRKEIERASIELGLMLRKNVRSQAEAESIQKFLGGPSILTSPQMYAQGLKNVVEWLAGKINNSDTMVNDPTISPKNREEARLDARGYRNFLREINVPYIESDQQFNGLAVGVYYVGADGKLRIKTKGTKEVGK